MRKIDANPRLSSVLAMVIAGFIVPAHLRTVNFFYKIVRHPIMLGFIIAFMKFGK